MPGADRGALSEPEIARRLPVWAALSNLFLDTQLQPDDHRRIAAAIRRAGYSTAEADAILRDEVTPVFHANLLSFAGEWVSWSDGDVRAAILEGLRRRRTTFWPRFTWPGKFRADRQTAMVRKDWDKVKGLLSDQEKPA
jgi:hypothetical protein